MDEPELYWTLVQLDSLAPRSDHKVCLDTVAKNDHLVRLHREVERSRSSEEALGELSPSRR